MQVKQEVNAIVDKMRGKSRDEMLTLLGEYAESLNIEDIFNYEAQLHYNYVAGLIQIVRGVEHIDFALNEFKEQDNPVWYEIIQRHRSENKVLHRI